jgi:hypothetical protein
VDHDGDLAVQSMLPGLVWQTSTFTPADNCVRLAPLPDGGVAVSDSKFPTGAMLSFTPAEWIAFVRGFDTGEFQPLTDRARKYLTG